MAIFFTISTANCGSDALKCSYDNDCVDLNDLCDGGADCYYDHSDEDSNLCQVRKMIKYDNKYPIRYNHVCVE